LIWAIHYFFALTWLTLDTIWEVSICKVKLPNTKIFITVITTI